MAEEMLYGDLGDGAEIFHDESWGQDRIGIAGKHALNTNGEDSVRLTFEQFLKVLEWGAQYKPAIEQMLQAASQ